MSHFQLFLPDVRGQKPELLEAVGLGDFFDEAVWQPSPGPEGKHGMLLAWPKPTDQRHVFNADQQAWQPAIPDGDLPRGRYFIGFWNDAPPTPANLKRRYLYRGRPFSLGDGQSWTIPEPAELPADVIKGDDGSWKFEVQRRFHDYYVECCNWQHRLVPDDDGKPPFVSNADVVEFLLQALRLNYRITCEVSNHLRLLNSENVSSPLLAACGMTALARQLESLADKGEF